MPKLVPRLRQLLIRRDLCLLAALLITGLLSLPAIARADSFSITTGGLLDSAAELFNALWPLFAVIAGIGLGIALVRFIVGAVQNALG